MPLVGSIVLAAVAGSVAAIVAARSLGVLYWGTSWALVIGFPISVLTTTYVGWWIYKRCDRTIGRWTLATAASLLFYLVAVAGVTWQVAVAGRDGPVLDWLALEALGGYAIIVLLTQVTLVVARDRLAGWGHRGRPIVVLLLALAAISMLVGSGTADPDRPLDLVEAPLADTWVAVVASGWVSDALYVLWMLSVLVGPLALWHAVGRSSGMARRRLSIAAVVSLLPVSIIACCVMFLPVLILATLPVAIAVDVLFGLFSVIFPLTVGGLAVALSGGEYGLQLHTNALKAALNTTVGLLLGLAAVALSGLLAVRVADGSVAVVVIATTAVVTLLWPLRRFVVRRLMLRADPRLGLAAALLRKAESASSPGQAARQVLRTALDDPTVEVAVRLPEGQGWVSVDGAKIGPPQQQPHRHITEVPDAGGHPHAYVVHATTTADAAGTIAEAQPLLDRAVLEVAVRHQAEQLAAERVRADAAAAAERRRLERDLHDGVQGRLLSVALELQAADAATEDGNAHLVLSDAVSSLRIAIDEMRRLASGQAPQTLGKEGLRAALTDVTARMPAPVTLTVPDLRLNPATETLAYLVVTEAVTNSVKHASPCSVDVRITVQDDVVDIRVVDDGPGGVDVRAGTGLRGLSERVHAAGGTLIVSDQEPNGTLVEAVLPCAP